MKRRKTITLAAVICTAAAGVSPALAQTSWRNYSCADGSQFLAGFFQYDKRAHLQIDGKGITLNKRLWLGGSRYSGRGVTLTITKSGARLKHGKRPTTTCEVTN